VNRVCLILCSVILLCAYSTKAQTWIWAKEALPHTPGSYGDVYFDHSVASDESGHAFETGNFINSISFGSQSLSSSYMDVFLVKYDSSGNALWAKQAIPASSASNGYGRSVATDVSGNSYITGYFTDTISFGGITLQSPAMGLPETFLVKYDPLGNVLWAKQSGLTTGFGYAYSVAVDASGNSFITGIFWGTLGFGGVTLSNIAKYGDVFIVKYDPNGNVLWAEQATTPTNGSYGWGNSVAVDASGNSYITGQFLNTLFFGSYTITSPSSYDMFLAKYDANGNLLWATQAAPANSSAYANAYSVSVDGPGNAYVTGQFANTYTFDAYTVQSPRTKYGDSTDVYLAKYDPNGNVLWVDQGIALDANSWRGYSVACDTLSMGGGYLAVRGNSNMAVPFKLKMGVDTFNLKTTNRSCNVILQFDSAGNILCGDIYTTSNKGVGYSGDSVKNSADGNALGVNHAGKYIYAGGVVDTASVLGMDSLNMGGGMPYVARWSGGCCTVVPAIKGLTSMCTGNSVNLTATGGTSFIWSNGATSSTISISPSSTTTYSVDISNGLCNKSADVTITVVPYPVPTVSPTQIICPGSSVSLMASGGSSYTWLPLSGLSCTNCTNPSASPASNTEYTVSVSNGVCAIKDSVEVEVEPAVLGSVCCNATIALGNDTGLNVSGASVGSTYSWSPAEGLSCVTCPDPVASPTVTTTYYVTITDTNGCSIKESVTIEVDDNCIYVPNAFSPNGDNENDFECVYGNCIRTMIFSIYDRWGNKVFESKDRGNCWDGKYNGVLMNSAVFVYYLDAVLESDKTVHKKGNITLVR